MANNLRKRKERAHEILKGSLYSVLQHILVLAELENESSVKVTFFLWSTRTVHCDLYKENFAAL